jgi:hypothetical protein
MMSNTKFTYTPDYDLPEDSDDEEDESKQGGSDQEVTIPMTNFRKCMEEALIDLQQWNSSATMEDINKETVLQTMLSKGRYAAPLMTEEKKKMWICQYHLSISADQKLST